MSSRFLLAALVVIASAVAGFSVKDQPASALAVRMQVQAPITCAKANISAYAAKDVAQTYSTCATATPTPAGGCATAPPLTGGFEYDTAFSPFCGGPWATKVNASCLTQTTNRCVATWSAALVNLEWASGNQCSGACVMEARTGPYGGNAVAYAEIWYAKVTDPLINLSCSGFCDHTDNGGYPAQIRMPAVGRAPGLHAPGTGDCAVDDAMAIIQPDGTEIDTAYGGCAGGSAAATAPDGTHNWQNGDTLTVGAAANCGRWDQPNLGWLQNGVVSASGRCLAAGRLRANELAAGHINHALALIGNCGGRPGGASWQYPANPGSTTDNCTGGTDHGPPLGGHLWWDENFCSPNVPPITLTVSEVASFCAMFEYGGYNTDDIFGGSTYTGFGEFTTTGGMLFSQFGQANPYASIADWSLGGSAGGDYSPVFMCSHGGCSTEWNPFAGHVGTNDSMDPKVHMHWVNDCAARGNCS